ncbi:family 43 glycosylhydrolase [Ruminococcus sp.]|uniref:family 43 glycosylhydrolase n=1 Tax=Ruminococcus sp. TaxID=41978 RepID=UPI001B1C743E|nr:family 43 glycosylhydrolase [Ruminococcus sp.]MBO5559694.1 family 43 glycosylhydrolase [Ruminococcus sp.]
MKSRKFAASLAAVMALTAVPYGSALADRKLGDVSGDDIINVKDISLCAAYVKNVRTLDEDSLSAADINGDGKVNITDVSLLAAHVKGVKPIKNKRDDSSCTGSENDVPISSSPSSDKGSENDVPTSSSPSSDTGSENDVPTSSSPSDSDSKSSDDTSSQTDDSSQPDEPYVEPDYDFEMNYAGIKKRNIPACAAVHDPSVLKVGDTYYIYGSHMSAAKCDDLMSWQYMANGYGADNNVYGQIYDVYDEAFKYAGSPTSIVKTDDADNGGTEHVWAPDVIYNKKMGKYVMYYCTTSNWCTSNLCYATSDSPEGPFEWQGAFIYSGFYGSTVKYTDVLDYVDLDYASSHYWSGKSYASRQYPNAIDPTVFYDAEGKMWLTYGSWSGGIFLLEIDEATGLPIHPKADEANGVDPYFGKRIAGGGGKSGEAPYILYDEDSGYYYLFISYGALNREGGYQIRVFRSDKPDGDYVDMNGSKLPSGVDPAGYGLKLSGNYMLPSLNRAYMATGHNSAFVDDDGKKYIVYHTRFDNNTEGHAPRTHQYLLNAEGWICMLPYQTRGETVSESGYSMAEVEGRYYMTDQGTDISADIAQPVILYLNRDGKAKTANDEGTWTMEEDSYRMTVTIGGKTYSGVFCKMLDEAQTEVMTFSAVGSNESIWGVKY